MKLLIFAVIVAVAYAASIEDDSVEIDPFMTSATQSVFGEYPSAVFIRGPNTLTQPLCGGTVIDRLHVLTSAQCVLNGNYELVNPFWFEITAGDTHMLRQTVNREVRRVDRIFVHQNYQPATRNK